MLEFPGGNKIAYLLGVFKCDPRFFRTLGITFNTSKNGKGCYKICGVLKFFIYQGIKARKIAVEEYSNGHAVIIMLLYILQKIYHPDTGMNRCNNWIIYYWHITQLHVSTMQGKMCILSEYPKYATMQSSSRTQNMH